MRYIKKLKLITEYEFPPYIDPLVKAFFLFVQRRAQTLAAAATFYVIISIVPFVLLIIRGIGLFAFDPKTGSDELFSLGRRFFPDVAPEIVEGLQGLVAGPLFAGGSVTLLNLIVLIISSLSFFNAIWSGMYLITYDRQFLSPLKHLRGIVVIGITVSMMTFLLSLPTIALSIKNILQSNFVTTYVVSNFPEYSKEVQLLGDLGVWLTVIIKSSIFNNILIFIYFIFLYRWFFSWRIKLSEAFSGAFVFVLGILLGKSSFWIYFNYVKDGLSRNYGGYYTVIVGLMWIFFVMCFFFYGVCLCYHLRKKRSEALTKLTSNEVEI